MSVSDSSSVGYCLNGHLMTRWGAAEGQRTYCCSVCTTSSVTYDQGLWCQACEFIRCVGCVAAACDVQCPAQHQLTRLSLPVSSEAVCDSCAQPAAPVATQAACVPCNYIICHRCVLCMAGTATCNDPSAFEEALPAQPLQPGLYWYLAWYRGDGYFSTEANCEWLLQRPSRQLYFQDGLLADCGEAIGCKFRIDQRPLLSVGDQMYFTLPEWFPPEASAIEELRDLGPFPETYVPTGFVGDAEKEEMLVVPNYWDNKQPAEKPHIALYLTSLIIVAVAVGALWGNLVICEKIGETSKLWTYVFAWLFVGYPVYTLLLIFILYYITKIVVGSKAQPAWKALLLGILQFVFGCCFGGSIAWTQAQQTAAQRFLAPEKTKTLNCWRNPNEVFNVKNHNFIVFEEADWIVDYKLRYNQGVSTLMGTGNDDVDDGKRYNFCLAPMSYRGLPNCPQNFYAACYRETSMSYLASCDDNDARTCGWDLPASGNLIRTMNHNEQFWSSAEEEDETYWQLALGFATPSNSATPVTNLIGFYSGEGPTEINAYLDKAKTIQRALLISSLVSFGGLMLLALLCLLNYGGEDDYVFWDETDWA